MRGQADACSSSQSVDREQWVFDFCAQCIYEQTEWDTFQRVGSTLPCVREQKQQKEKCKGIGQFLFGTQMNRIKRNRNGKDVRGVKFSQNKESEWEE